MFCPMSDSLHNDREGSDFAWVIIVALIAAFLFLVVPAFIKARTTSAVNACINNLRIVDAAANQFTLEHGLTTGDKINFPNDLTPYIKLTPAGKIPGCPNGGIYHLTKVGEAVTCSLGTTIIPAHVLQ